MVTKRELAKNCYDLQYKTEGSKANILLTLGTISAAGFFSAMFIKGYYFLGGVATFLIIVLAFMFYNRTRKNMEDIIRKIKKL
jgi:hypothetical protein